MGDEHALPVFERVSTGITGLDAVLRGGLINKSIYIVSGQPGAGKTVLANQMCFHHVREGGRAIFVTLLAETHDQMIEHLRVLDFFDPASLSRELYYISGFEIMEQEGLHGLLKLLTREIRSHNASLLVIDGLASAWGVSESDVSFKRFVHEMQVLVRAMNCTALLLTQRDDAHFRAEHTMVDGLIELSDEYFDVRAERHLTVSKFRGSGYLRGRHAFTITDAGIEVYPRTEALYTAPRVVANERRVRMAFDIAGLDEMLYGGLLSASATAIVGVPGSGKTLLGLHFLAAGARRGETGMYFGFYEEPSRLIEKADDVGLNFGAFTQQGLLDLQWETALEQPIDVLATRLLDTVARRQVQRLVIDGMNSFQQAASYPDRLGRFYTALFNELRARNVTVLFTVETPHLFGDPIEWPIRGVTSLSENMIFLRYIDVRSQLSRLVSVFKVRDSAYDTTIRTLTIDQHGIAVGGPFQIPDTMLARTLQPSPDATRSSLPNETPPLAEG
jgi:circadian clock protein KaiC